MKNVLNNTVNQDLLTKRELEVINRKTLRYPLAIAEKDYFLCIVSKIIYDSDLSDKLVYKGGTAIYHCYLPQLRFSEDLDFTSTDKSLTLEKVKAVLESADFLEVKKEYASKATIKIERLKYDGPLGLPNSLKVEIDVLQNVVLPAREIEYKNVWRMKTKVKVMDIKEVCAEKIRATSDRSRYRDFYDLFMILKNYGLRPKDVLALLRQKEIRRTISNKLILSNWELARKGKTEELERIYYVEKVPDSKIEKMLKELKFKDIAKPF